MSGTSYRVDETYIKVGKSCKYLYRAVDKEGSTIEFMFSAKRDVYAAKRFFKKMMRAEHRRLPFSISVDKNAAYPEAFSSSQEERIMPKDCELRRVKYLNNVIEQDHRFVKKKVGTGEKSGYHETKAFPEKKIYICAVMSKESTRQVFGREVLSREVGDFRLVECLYSAASEMPRHTHDISHISVVLRGSYTERYGQRERGCEVSTLIVHPPGEDHHVRFHAAGARIFSIHLRPRWVGRVRDYTKILDTPAAFRGWPSSLALRLYRELREWDAASPLAIESLVLGVVAAASRQAGTYEKQIPPWLDRVRDLLHARFAETIVFSELAAAAGVHPVYLAREFRRHFGCTAGEYVRRLRVEAACRVISGSDAPLSEIASSVGFYDQSHLTNVFKRLTGMSPARYRRAARSS